MRWAAEAWDTAVALRGEGVDIRAVTAWSLLGSHGWNTLLTAPGLYESGVFDVTNGTPRATALADLWKGFPTDAPRHPVVAEPGWWHRPTRLIYRPQTRVRAPAPAPHLADQPALLICGATGTLGQAFARACTARGIRHVITGRGTLDLERPETIASVLDQRRPWGVINAAGWVRVDEAEDAEESCHRANAAGAVALATACAARGIPCVNFSSDLVFDGQSARPYVESDPVRPLNAYGRSKAAMEAGCADLAGILTVRTAAFFSAADSYNFAVAVLDALAAGRPFAAADDHIVSPTFVPALVDATLDLLIDGATGPWHLTSGEAVSWADFAMQVAVAAAADTSLIHAVPGATLGWRAPRPGYAALGSDRGGPVGSLAQNIAQVVQDYGNARQRRDVA